LLVQAYSTAKRSDIASDFSAILNHHIPAKSSHVAGYMSSHPDAAAETRHIAGFLVRSDIDCVTNLGAVAISAGKNIRGKNNAEEDPGGQPE
jgi:hypothetical protein